MVAALTVVFVAAYVARDQSPRAVPARELLAEPDYFHGRVITVDTSKGWDAAGLRTIVFRRDMDAPPVIVANLPPGSPELPKTVRGVFHRGEPPAPHTIHPVP